MFDANNISTRNFFVKSNRIEYLQAQWLQSQAPNNFKTSQKCHKLYNVKKLFTKSPKIGKKNSHIYLRLEE